jgi:hypothetical protein
MVNKSRRLREVKKVISVCSQQARLVSAAGRQQWVTGKP